MHQYRQGFYLFIYNLKSSTTGRVKYSPTIGIKIAVVRIVCCRYITLTNLMLFAGWQVLNKQLLISLEVFTRN